MESRSWLVPTSTLCLYGFFKDMKPSESFLTPFLNSSYKHLDEKDISDKIYPYSTYAYLVFLVLMFLLTDFLRYKPLIVIESLAYLCTRILLIWGNGIPMMQLMQVTYGLASAAEIAYYSYIYAVVDESRYRQVSSYTRVATLLGKGLSDVIGQILISTGATNYLVLNYISFGSVSVAVIVAFFLPKVGGNVFSLSGDTYQVFENESSSSANVSENDQVANRDQLDGLDSSIPKSSCSVLWKLTLKRMFTAFKTSYSNKYLLMWSIWWAFAMCGGLQVEDYVMNLWSHITGSHSKKVYNGGVFACGTLFSALLVFLFSLIKVQWNGVVSEVLIGLISLLDTALLLIMAYTENVWIAYVNYVIFRASYAFVLTVASYQIALYVELKGYALIFGWNTFIALAMQSLLTFIVTDKNGLDLDIRKQFVVYGWYFGVIGTTFIARPFIVFLKRFCCRGNANQTRNNDESTPSSPI